MSNLPLPIEAPTFPSSCTLHHGDCLDVMPTLEPKSVAMVFADLPYGITHQDWDQCLSLANLWDALDTVGQGNMIAIVTATQPFATDLIVSNRSRFRYDLVWDKQKGTDVFNAKCRPMRSHEHILIFSSASCNPMSKNKMVYNPQKTDGKPYSVPFGVNELKTYGSPLRRDTNNLDGKRYPLSVQSFSRCIIKLHPTQKPVALLEWLIATYTNPGDTVLDPVMGSGTTAVACARLGRHFVGIEKDATYFEVASKRIADERARLGLDAPRQVN